jgi:hypothetical protein
LILTALVSCDETADIRTVAWEDTKQEVYPLITIDEQINLRSVSPTLYSSRLQDADGKEHALTGILRVDGQAYRFMGTEKRPDIIVAGMSYNEEWQAKYTFVQPSGNWQKHDFDDSEWDSGRAPFGSPTYLSRYYPHIRTIWTSPSIWVRRKIRLTKDNPSDSKWYLKYSHDDIFELYINGVHIIKTGFKWGENRLIEIPEDVRTSFRDNEEIILAAHGKNLQGEALLDFGIYIVDEPCEDRQCKYTFSPPSDKWEQTDFNDTTWNTGKAPFGTPVDYQVNTVWNTPEIWLRREIQLEPEAKKKNLVLEYSHDDVFDLYINGIQLVKTGFEWSKNRRIEIPENIKTTIKGNKLCVAAHCRNLGGGALADFDVRSDDIAHQTSVNVQATQTHYRFECGQVELKLDFTAPLLPNDIEVFSRPLNYISYEISSLDGETHEVEINFETAPGPISAAEPYSAEIYAKNDLWFIKTGKSEQKIFETNRENSGGYFFLCTDTTNTLAATREKSRICLTRTFGKTAKASGFIMAGYDERYAVQYFGDNLPPYWNRNDDKTIEQIFSTARRDYSAVIKRCEALNRQLQSMPEAFDYRETVSAFKTVFDKHDGLLLLSRNGASDILRSSSLFLACNSKLLKAQLEPLLKYGESDLWGKDFPPSNIGDYPLLNGQISSTQSPVETASNMMFLLATLASFDDNADYIRPYRQMISRWYRLLVENRRNPAFSDAASRGISSYSYLKNKLKLN